MIDNDENIKIVVVGDKYVGKTTFVSKLLSLDYIPLIEDSHTSVEFKSKKIQYHDTHYNLMVWDINGDDKIRPIVRGYYRGMDIILIVINNSNLVFLNSVTYWLEDIERFKDTKDSPIVGIVMLHTDENVPYEFEFSDVQRIGKSNKIFYWEIAPQMHLSIFLSYLINLNEVKIEKQLQEKKRFFLKDVDRDDDTEKCCLFRSMCNIL
jgi:small GTP-binding protein